MNDQKLSRRIKIHSIVFCVFFLIGWVAYSNSLRSGFMLDDHAFFDEKMQNIKFLPYQFLPDKDKALNIKGGKTDSYYRPIAHVIPMLSYLVFKDNTFGHHWVNLILFLFAVYCIYFLIYSLSQDFILSFIAALLYLIHPINGVFVNYITANVYAAQVILMSLSLICLLQSFKARRENLFYVLSLSFFTISLLCHETSMAIKPTISQSARIAAIPGAFRMVPKS